jgi:hypothetical protein
MTQAKDMTSKIAWTTQILAGHTTPLMKCEDVGPVLWELHTAIMAGELKIIKGNGKEQPPSQARVL